jgi:hypothetical protein
LDTFTHTTGDGAEHRFAHLSLYDVFGDPAKPEANGFVPLYRKRLKADVLENLRSSGLEKFEIAAELNGFDKHHRNRDPMEAFLEFLKEAPEAGANIVKRAYATANAATMMPELPRGTIDEVCWRLLEPFGISPTPANEVVDSASKSATYGDGGPDLPNPQAPLTYSTVSPSVTVGGEPTGPRSASA